MFVWSFGGVVVLVGRELKVKDIKEHVHMRMEQRGENVPGGFTGTKQRVETYAEMMYYVTGKGRFNAVLLFCWLCV